MDKEQIIEQAHALGKALHTLKRLDFTSRDDLGLKNSEKYFLWLLFTINNGKPTIPSDIARKAGVTLAAITHHINSLEKQGYIVRSPSPQDRRMVFISLSDKGMEMVSSLKKLLRKDMWTC
ncbi:MAG: MarR family transcriptional regulator [Firmicutes bacterium]|nr:MarR family transcriptional regulator [Bacillota bacterium]